MMNERGKSDPAVVAAKLANKAERSAAEPVEPRAGTKGNANQQHSGRTQSRETVSQVLARIRQTARERKKERFTALFHRFVIKANEHLRRNFRGRGMKIRICKGGHRGCVAVTSGVPQIADDLRRCQSRQPWAKTRLVRRAAKSTYALSSC